MLFFTADTGLRRLLALAAVFVFLALIASYLALDLTLAVVGDLPKPTAEPRAYRNVLGDLEPHLSLIAREIPGLSYRVTTNGQGLRGARDLPPRRPANGLRVLCLGDSFTYGVGVDDRFAYPALLESLLATRLPGMAVEVANTGVPFYDLFDETAYFLEKGRRMQPDVVVLQFYINDLESMAGAFFREGLLAREGGEYSRLDQLSGREGVERRLNAWMEKHVPAMVRAARTDRLPDAPGNTASRPYDRYKLRATAEEKAILGDRRQLLDQASLPVMERFWANYRQALLGLRDAVEASGAAFVLVLPPDVKQVREDLNAPAAALVGFCQQHGIPVIDPGPQFRVMSGENPDRYYLTPFDIHPNADGNTLVAKAVADAIQVTPGTPRPRVRVAPEPRAFPYAGDIRLNLSFGAHGEVLPARNGPVSITTLASDNLKTQVSKGAENDMISLEADLRGGPKGQLVLGLHSEVPLAWVSLTHFRRVFPPVNGSVLLSWSRDGVNFVPLTFAADTDTPPAAGLEYNRLVELDLRDHPATQLYFQVSLRNEAWIFVESRQPPWRRFEVVCYPVAANSSGISAETTDRRGWPDDPGPKRD